MNEITNPQGRLSYCEQAIAQGKQTFLEVGNALAEIMESQLYKLKGYGSFAEYCDKEWGFKKTYAYQLVNSAKAADSVSAIAENLNESQAREIAKVPEAKREEVIKKASKAGKMTAKTIKAAAVEETKPVELPIESTAPEPTLEEIASHIEPNVTAYYSKLEAVMFDAINNATDKQLASMSVYAALLPKLIKDEQRRREKNL